jgi:hypothetical protein
VIGIIGLYNIIIGFGIWCNDQANRRLGFNPYNTWMALFQHLDEVRMHDYVEFEVRPEADMKHFQNYQAPNF